MFIIHSMNDQARFEDIRRHIEIEQEIVEYRLDDGLPEGKFLSYGRRTAHTSPVERTWRLILSWMAIFSSFSVR